MRGGEVETILGVLIQYRHLMTTVADIYCTWMKRYRDIQTQTNTDRQREGVIQRGAGRQLNIETCRQAGRKTSRQTDRPATDRQTGR